MRCRGHPMGGRPSPGGCLSSTGYDMWSGSGVAITGSCKAAYEIRSEPHWMSVDLVRQRCDAEFLAGVKDDFEQVLAVRPVAGDQVGAGTF